VSASEEPPPSLPVLAFPAPPEIPFRLISSLAARSLIKSPPPPVALTEVSTASSCFFFLIFLSPAWLNLVFLKPRMSARRFARPESTGSDVALSAAGLHHSKTPHTQMMTIFVINDGNNDNNRCVFH